MAVLPILSWILAVCELDRCFPQPATHFLTFFLLRMPQTADHQACDTYLNINKEALRQTSKATADAVEFFALQKGLQAFLQGHQNSAAAFKLARQN
jgi:hypothetical protein